MSDDQRYFLKVKKSSNQVVDFKTIEKQLFDSDESVASSVQDDDHFRWIEYVENEIEEVVEDIYRLRWRITIDGEDFGPLENMMTGAVLDEVRKSFMPRINFGDSDPKLYRYDYINHEWKSPLYSSDGVLVWDEASGDYVPFLND